MTERISPEDEVLSICRDLIRIDTSNYGDGSGPGEREAAELVMGLLTEVGFEPELIESAPRRSSVLLRIPGEDPTRGALVLHGHTDVVPAAKDDWSVDPFGAEVRDGMVWGRGAVDMKNMDAMILSVARSMGRDGWRPPRDLVVGLLADEEAGGRFGAHWLVDHRPDVFEGATEAISEVGGFSAQIAGQRVYLLQTAEKGLAWLRLVAQGRAGHGSQVNEDNAVAHLAAAVARIGRHEWPLHLNKTVRALFDGVAELTGTTYDPEDPDSVEKLVEQFGSVRNFVGSTIRTSAHPTQLDAGYKANVVPGSATASLDVRPLPGHEAEVRATLAELAGDKVRIEEIHTDIGLEVPYSGDLVDAMVGALGQEDPDASVLPYMLSGGTDNKALSRLGITGYGFAPLRLDPELDFAGMFHGVDERVNIDALTFGARVLERVVRTS
ncbi:M20/M25/M40 family metallo-hydrolase [Georgenia sp. Z1491]|uniref:M20/M25/M40 family metallo-hydrolase n=1 Tax=Georgenia sp. Z1491 TaxID=3416707 RepID=UPI003CEED587